MEKMISKPVRYSKNNYKESLKKQTSGSSKKKNSNKNVTKLKKL
jgi:hypothetical protein